MLLEMNAPIHGWLPILVDLGDFKLQAEASNVPCDPIEGLLKVLRLCWSGGQGVERVVLFEEPFGWGLDFSCTGKSPKCSIQVWSAWNWSMVNNVRSPKLRHETEIDRLSVGKAIATSINEMLRTFPRETLTDWNPEQTYARTFSEIQKTRLY